MEDIYESIKNYKPDNADITNKTYASRVNTVINAGMDINNYKVTIKFLRDKYSQKTYKSFLTSIIVYLNSIGETSSVENYSKEMKSVNDDIQTLELKQIPTEKEKENMITRKEIESIIGDLKNKLDSSYPELDKFSYLDDYKKYLVANLYYLIPPLRSDFVGLEVHEEPLSNPDMKKNYIYTNKGVLVLNRYKTSKKYGTNNQSILPKNLLDIIVKWMKIRVIIIPSLESSKELLFTKNLTNMNQVNLTHLLNRIFNKKVSTTILRKSYITEKYPVSHTTEEMKKDAEAMKHSISVQQTTYRKKA